MKTAGIVCEYAPFHAGHAHHLAQTRAITGADYVVCAMSGYFTQRGDPAPFDKFTRAHAALNCGADLVVELPVLSAVRSARPFALGGVKTLAACGADYLSFGSECADLDRLQTAARVINDEPAEYRAVLKAGLDRGLSFPHARAAALAETAGIDLNQSNDLLAAEYLCAIERVAPHIAPVAVRREGAGYNDTTLSGGFPSATALRARLDDFGSLGGYIPAPAYALFNAELSAGFVPPTIETFNDVIIYALRTADLSRLPDSGEGLSNRLKSAAMELGDVTAVIDRVCTRRYTRTRVCRLIICALLGITVEQTSAFDASPATYVRVLGVRETALPLLSAIARRVPVVTTPTLDDPFLAVDVHAAGVYSAVQKRPPFCDARREFTRKLLKV